VDVSGLGTRPQKTAISHLLSFLLHPRPSSAPARPSSFFCPFQSFEPVCCLPVRLSFLCPGLIPIDLRLAFVGIKDASLRLAPRPRGRRLADIRRGPPSLVSASCPVSQGHADMGALQCGHRHLDYLHYYHPSTRYGACYRTRAGFDDRPCGFHCSYCHTGAW
jgi:hypothetical protein